MMGRGDYAMTTAAAERKYVITEEESAQVRLLKLWFIVLVVWIHAYAEEVHFGDGNVVLAVPAWLATVKYAISRVIARCAVPGFFFFSALFLYRRPFGWRDNMRKKVRTLLVPYVIVTTFWVVVFFAVLHIPALGGLIQEDSFYNVRGWSAVDLLNAYLGLGGPEYLPLVYPLWFVRDLLVLNLLAVALKWLVDRFPVLVLAALAVLTAVNVQMIWFLSVQGLVFFCLGYYAVRYGISLSSVKRLPFWPLAALYGLSVAADCMLRGMPVQHLARAASIVLGLLFFARLSFMLRPRAWRDRLLKVAGYVTAVYFFHEPALTLLKKVAVRVLPQTPLWQLAQFFGIPAVVIGLCLVGGMAFKRVAPRLYGVVTGGRG